MQEVEYFKHLLGRLREIRKACLMILLLVNFVRSKKLA